MHIIHSHTYSSTWYDGDTSHDYIYDIKTSAISLMVTVLV